MYNDKKELTTEAADIIVFFDFVNNTKTKIPDALKNKIQAMENRITA